MVKLNQRPVSRPLKDRLYSPYPATSARNFRPPQEHLNLLIDACKSATCPVHTLLGRIVRLKSVGGNWQVLWVISRKSWKRKNSNLLMVQNWHVSVTWVWRKRSHFHLVDTGMLTWHVKFITFFFFVYFFKLAMFIV